MFVRVWTFVWASVWCVSAASAAVTYEPRTTDEGWRFILISGELGQTDRVDAFEAIVRTHDPAFVIFDSPGGNVYFAMELGRAIRRLGLGTAQFKPLECSSACTLAFLGGVDRIATPGAIGVHRSSFGPDSPFGRDEAVAAVQQGTADVLTYLAEMGVDAELLRIALSYDENDMRYLSGSEMAQLRVTTPDRPSEPDFDSAPSAAVPPAQTAPAAQPTIQSLEADALTFVKVVVGAHNKDPDAAIRAVSQNYSDTIQYYGKSTYLFEVIDDKRKYFLRWPERAYRIRDETVSVSCTSAYCDVSGYYDWSVRSLPRNRQASGMASFRYRIDTTQGMRIVAETSEIVER